MLMEHQTTKSERVLKLLQLIPRNCLNDYKLYQGIPWINCKTNVSTERWNNRVEFMEKVTNLEKIYFFLNRILWAFQWYTLSDKSLKA